MVQTLQNVTNIDKIKLFEFCLEMQHSFENIADESVFPDEATFSVSDKVNKQNFRFGETENLRLLVQHLRDSTKCSVLCPKRRCTVPCFFPRKLSTGKPFLVVLSVRFM